MSDAPTQIELSDAQREDVRKLLAKFSAKKGRQKKREKLQEEDKKKIAREPDPLEQSPSGSTIEWTDLKPKCRRYTFA